MVGTSVGITGGRVFSCKLFHHQGKQGFVASYSPFVSLVLFKVVSLSALPAASPQTNFAAFLGLALRRRAEAIPAPLNYRPGTRKASGKAKIYSAATAGPIADGAVRPPRPRDAISRRAQSVGLPDWLPHGLSARRIRTAVRIRAPSSRSPAPWPLSRFLLKSISPRNTDDRM